MNKITIILCGIFAFRFCYGQEINTSSSSVYDPNEAFAPLFYPMYGDKVRAADGTPGSEYWQNTADYNISCKLSDDLDDLTSEVKIDYTNNSPQNLSFVWLQLDQNLFKENSTGNLASASLERFNSKDFEGYTIKMVKLNLNGKVYNANYAIYDTRMKIILPEKLPSKGGKIQISIGYEFKITENGVDRSGRLKTKNGWITEIAQWFPRMCVYDNVNGWNTLPYIGVGEFYLEYGNINYEITAPANQLIFGSGKLLNPKEVLTEIQQKRLKQAEQSDNTVFIQTAEEINQPESRPKDKKYLTWKFLCENTRNVAWASSSAFIWDAAKINLPDGKSSLAMSAYPVESVGNNAWSRSTQYIKGAIENLSKYLIPFSYPNATAIAGTVSGMEYPGIVFCAAFDKDYDLWFDISHEFGHNWFPMLVGSNERKFP